MAVLGLTVGPASSCRPCSPSISRLFAGQVLHNSHFRINVGILFAVINPSVTYWAFSFPSTILIVFGADFVYSCGTIFIAKTVLPHEHSVGGALFQTMTQVSGKLVIDISPFLILN